MKNKQKTWFDGLKFAESLGYEVAFHYVATNRSVCIGSPFNMGMLSYLDYCRDRLGVK